MPTAARTVHGSPGQVAAACWYSASTGAGILLSAWAEGSGVPAVPAPVLATPVAEAKAATATTSDRPAAKGAVAAAHRLFTRPACSRYP